ncbi:hypothetical protein BH11MYX1_BH11MYX1_43060 [soil metagenome]
MKHLLVILCATATASATPMEDAITAALAPMLPANLGIARVFVPVSLASATPTATNLVVEPPMQPRAGRPSIKITFKHRTIYVPVALSALVDVAVVNHAIAAGSMLSSEDFSIEHRAIEGAGAPASQVAGGTLTRDLEAGAPVGAHDIALPPPSPRGMRVSVAIAHGGVHIQGTGVLELSARVGETATVRLAFNQTVLKGVMTSPGVVTVGDEP